MFNLRNIIHDLIAPIRVRIEKPKFFHNVKFKYFANSLGTFKTINSNEPRSVEFALSLQNLGVTNFLDIGSSFGVWTLPFLQKGKKDQRDVFVLAIDAHHRSCVDLYKNASLNDLNTENMMIFNSAVGLKNGLSRLYFPKYASNMGSIAKKNNTRRLFNQETDVLIVDINFFVEAFKPDLIKIDIEGIDLQVAARISELLFLAKVISVEVTPTNLFDSGKKLLDIIITKYPFIIPITKEMENNQSNVDVCTLKELIETCQHTRKTNVFFFKEKRMALNAKDLINSYQ